MTGAAADSPTDRSADKVFRLTYRSQNLIPAEQRRQSLGDLFSQARSANKRRHVTGALLLLEDAFVQTLEGEEDAVRGLFDRIERDPRHDDVSLLDARLVESRVFARWAMARVSEDGEPDIALIAHADGIAAAAGRGDGTPEQEEVLAFMREAARAGHQTV